MVVDLLHSNNFRSFSCPQKWNLFHCSLVLPEFLSNLSDGTTLGLLQTEGIVYGHTTSLVAVARYLGNGNEH